MEALVSLFGMLPRFYLDGMEVSIRQVRSWNLLSR